jgi:hypothetical protein
VLALTELDGRPLEEVCTGLLQRMLPRTPQDDVALVALRLAAPVRPQSGV